MVAMEDGSDAIALSMSDLRAVTGFAAECAHEVLPIFEAAHPGDGRPRAAIDAAREFARGGKRGKALRDNAWAALKAAGEADAAVAKDAAAAQDAAAGDAGPVATAEGHAGQVATAAGDAGQVVTAVGDAGRVAAGDAARAAMAAAGAAYLHPLARATQVKHILGSVAHAARAAELAADDQPEVGAEHVERARRRVPPEVVDVLSRYPAAPAGGGRVGELIRALDAALRR